MGGWVAAALFCLVVVTTGVQGLTGNQYDLYDHLRSWTCPADEEVWSTGDAVLLSHFADGAWTNEDATCAAPATLTRCSDAAPVPDHSEVKKEYKTTDGSYTFGVFYECASGFAWLSGARGKLTQCKNGKWTTIFDVCTEECPIKSARDCADVHQFGFRETKMYRLTGDEGSYEAHCILDEVPANSGWTFAFRQTEGNDRFHNDVLGSTAYSQHEEGLYDPSSSSYLIGLKKLVAMNRNEDGSRRPLTFLFKITAHDGSKYHASYNGVNIGNASMGYQLEEIGEYHGNAGDSFRKNLGNIFEHYGGAGAFFWAPPSQFDAKEGVYLTFAPIVWETLTDCPDCSAFIPRTVEIYVRPKSWDEATSCPYTNLTHPAWKTVTVDMPISRAPGTNITYTCLGDLMMEGRVGEERTVAGVMHCLNGTDGSLAWDWIPTLPCTFTCPENFTEAPRGGVCYHYSTDDAEFGLVSASLRCSEMGATLAMFTEISDLQNATDDQCYLSSYIKRNDQAVYPWDLNPTLFTCDATEQCQNTDDKNQCYLVCKPDKYRVQDCSIPTPYACMLPAQCPTTYTFYNGLCYKIETFTGSYLDAVYTCNLLGAGLAVPETPEVLNGIGELARVNLHLPAEFLIAVNDREEPGNYNIGGIYSPNEAMVDVLTEARGNLSFSYFTMVEHPEVEVMPTLHTQDSTMTGSFWAVCQFGGPFGCWTEPPEPLPNMTRQWNNKTNWGEKVHYDCYPGYFVGGDVTLGKRQTLECMSQFGQWFFNSNITSCLPAEVCLETITVPSDLITNVTDNFRYLNGSISFFCPDNMTTASGDSVQTVACVTDGSNYYLNATQVLECDVCSGEPPTIANGTTNWVPQTPYHVGQVITGTCNESYLIDMDTNTQDAHCTPTGWGEFSPCYEACIDPPPVPGPGMTMSNFTWNGIGALLNYTCDSGMMIPTNETFPDAVTFTEVQCGDDGQWLSEGRPFTCAVLCLDDPVPAPRRANTTWNNYTRVAGTEVVISCYDDLVFKDLNNSHTVTCQDNGNWTTIDEKIMVCRKLNPDDPPPPPPGSVMESPDPPFWSGDYVTYTCEDGLMSPFGTTYYIIISTRDGWTILDPEFGCFNVCSTDPLPAGANMDSSWDGVNKVVGTVVQYTCDEGGLFGDLNATMNTTCEDSGEWTDIDANLFSCKILVPGDPPPTPPGATLMSQDPPYWVPAAISYICGEDQLSPMNTRNYTIFGNESGWSYLDPEFGCYNVCQDDPYDPPEKAESDWNGYSRTEGIQVQYTCEVDHVFADFNTTLNITCEGHGNWSSVDESIFICRIPIPCDPPPAPPGATLEGSPPYWAESVVSYSCGENQAFPNSGRVVNITANATGWPDMGPDFQCYNACQPLPPLPDHVTHNLTGDGIWGDVIQYECRGIFIDGTKYITDSCESGNWTLSVIPECEFTETTGPTTTTAPIVLPTMPPYDVSYPATTDYYWGTIHKGMEDVNGVEDNYEVTAGPFGFGQAISVSSDKEQCVKQSDYNIPSDECSGNPLDCDKGLSISVWEKPIFSDTVFEALNNSALATKKYVLSTGGDITGHPGVAIYHDGLYLVAVVSTGDEYWKLKVAGPLANDTWSNIAIRWEKPGADDGTLDEKTGGLEMFVNLKKVGHQVDSLSSAPAKDPLDPTEMMLGCHKDADNQQYRGFNDAEYDELATWTRKLPDNETLFFFGGYEANFSDIEPDKFQSMLTQVELKDPAQMAFAINILSKMTSTENVDPTTATPTEAASTSSSSGPTAGSPTASTTQSVQDAAEAAGVKQISTMRNIMKTMTNLNNINPDMPYTGFKSAMSLLDVASNLLGKDSFPKWRGLQSKKDEPGSAELVENLGNWLTTMAREVAFDNETEVIDYAKATDNIMVRVVKMMPEDLAKKGKYFETPNYKHPDISPHMDEWDLPYDRAVVPTDLFADARCMERPVSLTMQLFDTYDDVVPMKVNPATLRPLEENVIDARVIAIDVTVDLVRKPDGLIDPSAPDCKPDPDKLKETPVRYKLEHNIKEFSLRQLSFHSDEKQTEIRQRYCVWWNEDLGDFGVWDTTGCSLLKTTDEHTLCACDHFGTFSILAEKIEPKEVPEEKLWLTILRYVGYSLSFFCLIIYIVVIAFSGDLKEQFHLMGMNLSIAVLLGSICMLITDIPAVREDRHACTALGTLLHVFYLTAGAWIAALGHACFSAITSGVIGGRLRAYWFICWGFPLISMGLTYLLFLHDLGDDPRCFIAWENEPKYVFFSPQMLFVFFSFFFGTIVLCNLATPALRKDNLIDDYGTFCRGASFVMLFFDLIWTFGLLTYVRFGFRDPDFYPIFQVLNSWMGLMILLFIGMGSKRWRMVVLGQAKLRRKMLLGYEFGGSKPVDSEKERLGSPDDQRSKASSRPSSRPSSGRASPISASAVDMDRPPTAASDFPSRPASRGMVAGRPGSRMSSATT